MNRKLLTLVGLALILGGCLALFYREIHYTRQERILDAGPFKASMATPRTISIHPVIAGLAVAGGVGLVIAGARKRD